MNGIAVRTGGTETFLLNLVPRLAENYPTLNLVLVVRESRSDKYAGLPGNVEVRAIPDARVNTPVSRMLFEHLRLPAQYRSRTFDLHFQVDEMLSPSITMLGTPNLTVFHTTPMVLFDNEAKDGWLFEQYARFVRRHSARRGTLPVTVSYHAKAELSGMFPFARDRFRVVYHGVDQRHYSPGQPSANPLAVHGITSPYLLSISNRFTWKNYYRLIQAYHLLVSSGEVNCPLVLIGQAKVPEEEARINRYLVEHHLRDHVRLVDYIEQSALPDVYRGALAYVFPSLRETFGLTVLEAMSSGIPVACARWGPLPEVAADAAYYFDPLRLDDMSRAMSAVANETTVRDNLLLNGLAHARLFTWERAANEYHELMMEAAQRSPRSHSLE